MSLRASILCLEWRTILTGIHGCFSPFHPFWRERNHSGTRSHTLSAALDTCSCHLSSPLPIWLLPPAQSYPLGNRPGHLFSLSQELPAFAHCLPSTFFCSQFLHSLFSLVTITSKGHSGPLNCHFNNFFADFIISDLSNDLTKLSNPYLFGTAFRSLILNLGLFSISVRILPQQHGLWI